MCGIYTLLLNTTKYLYMSYIRVCVCVCVCVCDVVAFYRYIKFTLQIIGSNGLP